MKKQIFTLLTLLSLGLGAWADAETIFDAADAGWSSATLTSGTTTIGDVTWYGRGSAEINNSSRTISGVTWSKSLKTGGASTYNNGSSYAGLFTFTPSNAGILRVYGRGGGNSARYLYVTQSTATSTNNDPSIALGSATLADGSSQQDGVAEAEVVSGTEVVIYVTNGSYIYGMTFEETGAKTVTTKNDPVAGAIAYLDNSGAITGSDTEPYEAYKMSYSGCPMSVVCSTADASQSIQAGSDNYKFTIAGNNYTAFKVSKNKTYIIEPIEGVTINSVTAYGSSNSGSASQISTYGGTYQGLGARGDSGTPVAVPGFSLVKNTSGKFEFTIGGSASQAIVVLVANYDKVENVDVKVSSAGYATLYYNKNLVVPAGVKAYKAAVSGSNIALTDIGALIPANTGVILEAAQGSYNFITTSAAASAVDGNILTGTTSEIATPSGAYTLGQNGEGVVGLRSYSGAKIRAYSAYSTDGSLPAARDFYGFSDDVTAINKVETKKAENGMFYNLAGQQVSQPAKGLYIVNGKKVIIK